MGTCDWLGWGYGGQRPWEQEGGEAGLTRQEMPPRANQRPPTADARAMCDPRAGLLGFFPCRPFPLHGPAAFSSLPDPADAQPLLRFWNVHIAAGAIGVWQCVSSDC